MIELVLNPASVHRVRFANCPLEEALGALRVLAKMLGIHISVAVAWQRASAGDWAGYAADISR